LEAFFLVPKALWGDTPGSVRLVVIQRYGTLMTDPLQILPKVALSPYDAHQLELLRAHRRAHRVKRSPQTLVLPEPIEVAELTRGQRMADRVAATMGSWRFIMVQSVAIGIWITFNVVTGVGTWDPYPFILLNLLLSFQAAYTAPAIMMSQNRQSELDRRHAQNDYEINVKAELEIELLHEKIDILKEQEFLALTQAVKDLTAQVQALSQRPSA
jgi:uncharacterized membrane protein